MIHYWVGVIAASYELLLEIASKRREDILRKVSIAREKYIEERVKEVWNPVELEGEVRPLSITGIDGSSAKVEFQGFTFYGVDGVAIKYFTSNAYSKSYSNYVYTLGDLDILIPPKVSDRVSIYREILEAKTSILSLIGGRTEILLMDGSLKSVLISPLSIKASIVEAIERASSIFGEEVYFELENLLRESLRSYEKAKALPLVSKVLISRDISAIPEDDYLAAMLLEYLEKLSVYRELLKLCNEESVLVAFIAKTGRSQIYFSDISRKIGRHIPTDIMLFQNLTSEPGYSKPIIEGRPIKGMPEILSLKNFYNKLRIATSYIRIERGGPVLKVELPYLNSVSEAKVEEDIINLLKYLKSVSVNGYPYVLLEAHELSKISKDSLMNIILALGLNTQRTGREVLEEWLLES